MPLPQKGDINPETGKEYAWNPSTGAWDDNYWATVVEPKLKANYQPTSDEISARQMELARQAVQPAIDSLEASIPETQARYQTERERLEGRKEPLVMRYDNLINQIANNQTQSVNQQTKATNNEMARRGISNDSGFYEQNMADALNPIRANYASMIKDAGLSKEEALDAIDADIASLFGLEIDTVRNIRNTITQLQAGAGTGALDRSLNIQQMNESTRQFNESNQLAKERLLLEKALAAADEVYRNTVFNQVTLPTAQNKLNTDSSLKSRYNDSEWEFA